MELFRISKERYKDDLTGTGARLYSGRWNNVGTAVLYSAQNRSLAMAEDILRGRQSFRPRMPDNLTLYEQAAEHVAEQPGFIPSRPSLKTRLEHWISGHQA